MRNRLMHSLSRARYAHPMYIRIHIQCICIYVHAASDLKFRGENTLRGERDSPSRTRIWAFREAVVSVCEENSRPRWNLPRDTAPRSLFIRRTGYGTSYLESSSRTLARRRTFTTEVFEDRGGSTAASGRFIFIVMRSTPQREGLLGDE